MTCNIKILYLINNNWYFVWSKDLNVIDLFYKNILVINVFDKNLQN